MWTDTVNATLLKIRRYRVWWEVSPKHLDKRHTEAFTLLTFTGCSFTFRQSDEKHVHRWWLSLAHCCVGLWDWWCWIRPFSLSHTWRKCCCYSHSATRGHWDRWHEYKKKEGKKGKEKMYCIFKESRNLLHSFCQLLLSQHLECFKLVKSAQSLPLVTLKSWWSQKRKQRALCNDLVITETFLQFNLKLHSMYSESHIVTAQSLLAVSSLLN